jgi:hypothetical protein
MDSDPLQSAAEAGAWARRAPGPACSESCTLQSTAEELLPTSTSLLHSFICRPHMKSNISLPIHHCNSISTHFSLVGQAQRLGAGRSLGGASSPNGATSMQASFSYTPLPPSSLSNASLSADVRAHHNYSGRAHIGVSPGPERRRLILLQLRTGPDLLLQWRLGWPGGRTQPGGTDWCSPTSRSKLPLPCTVRTRANSAETRGCRVVQSRSRPFSCCNQMFHVFQIFMKGVASVSC